MPKILAIDDKADNLVVISALLKHLLVNYELITAQSGRDGFEKAKIHQPDTILLDIIMPEMDGYAVCRMLKQDERTRHIPVIMLTAIRTDSGSRIKGLEAGAISFITKPIDEVELIAQINVALRIKKAEDALRREKAVLEDTVQERTQELRGSQELLKRFMNAATDGMTVMDSNLNVLEANKAALNIFGIKRENVIGRSIEEISPSAVTSGRYQRYLEVIKTGAPYFVDAMIPNPVLGDLMVFIKAFKVDNGLGVIFTDITARKKAEEALRRSEQKFKSVTENAPDIIYMITADGIISYINPAWESLLGHRRDEVIGRQLVDFADKDHLGAFHSVLQEIKDTRQTLRNFTCPFIHKDGTRRMFNMSGAPKLDIREHLTGIVGHLEDVTERRRLEYQLRQAQKMEALGTLASGIAHDFNNILFAILGFGEMIMYDISDTDSVRKSTQQIINASVRARDLVQQILSFTRPGEQERRLIQIHTIAKEVLVLLRASFPSTIEIRHHIAKESDTVSADPTQIHQILMNLCTNAQQSMADKKGVLEISLSPVDLDATEASGYGMPSGPYVKLSVSDTGQGMDSETIERIYDPYFTTKAPGEGTGLGLAVVHGIVKSLDGYIFVRSNIGEGTTFDIFLKRIETETVQEIPVKAPIPRGCEHILFVDDEVSLVDLGRQMLNNLGYKVSAENSSTAALDVFRASPEQFDLVITDMTMPNMTGADLARQLIAIRSDIPIILCTGYSDQITRQVAEIAGIKKILWKPFTIRDMAVAVREILNGS